QGAVLALAFSPAGKILATAGDDQTARLGDAATFQPIGPPLQHQRDVHAVAFSPDGKTLATVPVSGEARLWAVPTPLAGDAERIDLWTRTLVGMELDSGDAIQALDVRQWERYRQELEKLGG